MKNLKKLMFGLVALVLAFGLVFSVSATKKKDSVYWRYNQNTSTDIRDGYSYSATTAPESEECDPGTDLPCVIAVDASISTQSLLDDYLKDTDHFENDSDITAAAMFKKASE